MDIKEQEIECLPLGEDLPTDGDFKTSLKERDGRVFLEVFLFAIHGDHQISQKWIQRLGFRWEAPMLGYGPDGATYVRFARVREPQRE